jgi:hypothetical protein
MPWQVPLGQSLLGPTAHLDLWTQSTKQAIHQPLGALQVRQQPHDRLLPQISKLLTEENLRSLYEHAVKGRYNLLFVDLPASPGRISRKG